MKKQLLILGFICLWTSVFSQKKTIAIASFKTGSNISLSYKKAIEEKVKEAFYATNRFNIVDRTNLEQLKAEKELQKSEDFIDGNTVNQSSLDGAEQIIMGSISQVNVYRKTTETSYYYKCRISFSLQVIDVESGKVLASELIQPSQSFGGAMGSAALGGAKSKDKAFYNELKGMQKSINKFVGKHFPITTSIIEITENVGGKAKKLLINTGHMNGSKKSQEFIVKELVVKKVGEKELVMKKYLGKIKITKVEGDEISAAKVTKGGELIYSKFNAGAKIECISNN